MECGDYSTRVIIQYLSPAGNSFLITIGCHPADDSVHSVGQRFGVLRNNPNGKAGFVGILAQGRADAGDFLDGSCHGEISSVDIGKLNSYRITHFEVLQVRFSHGRLNPHGVIRVECHDSVAGSNGAADTQAERGYNAGFCSGDTIQTIGLIGIMLSKRERFNPDLMRCDEQIQKTA